MSDLIPVSQIDALLPQTQCGKCGHPGCQPYAEGIAQGEAINKCPPGGQHTVAALAALLKRPELPLELAEVPPQVAVIREAECIGCTKCIQACPVDAIVGAAKLMHSVIRDECSGCELCLAPCPVDCIDMIVLTEPEASMQRGRADQFRRRHQARLQRLAAEASKRQQLRASRQASVQASNTPAPASATDTEQYKRLKVEAAMARVALNKTERQLAQHGTPELEQKVAELRLLAERAQQALAQATPAAEALPSEGLVALKNAKVQYALARSELSKAQRLGADEATLTQLKQQLAAAQTALHQAETNSGKPAPDLVRTDKQPVDEQLRELKTRHAYARAEYQRLERRQKANPEAVSPEALAHAKAAFEQAQQSLDDYSAH